MENLMIFLESTSIHGLSYISTSKRHTTRLLWILVVSTGFIGAGVLIHQSFEGWADSPIKTTVETVAIDKMTFPKVTVCPPKNTYTDLNYELMMTQNMTLDNKTRNELYDYALELLLDHLNKEFMTNLSKLEDNDRYYNWYHAYTQLTVHQKSSKYMRYTINTSAKSGTIATNGFGRAYDAEKADTYTWYWVYVKTPRNFGKIYNLTLQFEIEKISIVEYGSDKFYHDSTDNAVSANIKHISKEKSY